MRHETAPTAHLLQALCLFVLASGCAFDFRHVLNSSSKIASIGSSGCPNVMRTLTPFAGGDGSASHPYLICTAAQFEQISGHMSDSFKLASDVDMTGATHSAMGSDTNRFEGTLDGDGYAIKNWTVSSPAQLDTDPIALFHTIGDNGVVKNLNLQDFDLEGNNYVAGLAFTIFGEVDEVQASGHFKSKASVAPLATYIRGAIITHVTSLPGTTVYSSGDGTMLRDYITPGQGTDMGASGLISMGNNSPLRRAQVQDSINYANVTWNPTGYTLAGWIHTAGIVAYPAFGVDLLRVTNYGDISAIDEAGGVASLFESATMDHALNFGNIQGRDYIGGLVGWGDWGCSVTNSYSAGTITGGNAVGGLIGAGHQGLSTQILTSATYATVRARSGAAGIAGTFYGTMSDVLAMSSVAGTDPTSDIVAGVTPHSGGTISRVVMNERQLSNANSTATSQALAIFDFWGVTASNNFYISYSTLPAWTESYSSAIAEASVSDSSQYTGLDFSASGPWAMGSSTKYFDGSTHPIPRWMCALSGVTCN